VEVQNISNPVEQNEKRYCSSTTLAGSSPLNPAPSTSKSSKEQRAKIEHSELAVSTLNCGNNHKETSEQITLNKARTKSVQPPPLERAGSPISGFKKKKLRVLSSSSSEEDEPILLKSKIRRLNKREKEIVAQQLQHKTNVIDKRVKPCKILAHRLSVPDQYTFGAHLKKQSSRNSRHPYTIKKWLKLNKNTKLSKDINEPKKKTTENQLLLNKGSSLLLLDALETPIDNNEDHEVMKKFHQHETRGEVIYICVVEG
jgi:hypothetical protein